MYRHKYIDTHSTDASANIHIVLIKIDWKSKMKQVKFSKSYNFKKINETSASGHAFCFKLLISKFW